MRQEQEKHVAFMQAGIALIVVIVVVVFMRPLAGWIFGERWIRLCQGLMAVVMGAQFGLFIFRWRSLREDHRH